MSEKKAKVNLRSRAMLPEYTAEQLTAIAASVGLTKDQLEVAGNIAHQIYQEIGADMAELNDGKAMKRYDVIEVCLDAGRPQEAIRHGHCKYTKGADDPAILEWFDKKASLYPLETVYAAIAAVAFRYPAYE